jgi:ribosomal protein L9
MPYQDGTGPFGEGQLTGRGLGPCGRGLRSGYGRRFGFRRGYRYVEDVNLTKEEQKKIMEQELKDIESEKKEIENALKELK